MRDAEPGPVDGRRILRTYVVLTFLSILSSSFIWGVNTLFLIDAGLSVTGAFAANAFFTLGQVLFEIPTGVVADMLGRRASYLLGSATLFVSTLLYLALWRIHGPFWAWAVVSMILGLGFTFFSGATEAWLVDGLKATGYEGTLESAFARGQVAAGFAMLTGTLAGGAAAQAANLGAPYVLRAIMLGLTFLVACVLMHDVGFERRREVSVFREIRRLTAASLTHGIRNRPVRWLMLAEPFGAGVAMYAFYAAQPYLLDLYGRKDSYAIAGLAAAIVAGAQIVGGALVPAAHKVFRRRTSLLIAGTIVSAASLALLGRAAGFWIALGLLGLWGTVFAATLPVRQAFINGLIPSQERATVLSSYNLLGSSGGVVFQPALGRVADLFGYPASFLAGAAVELLALPFFVLARLEKASSDPMTTDVVP